MSNNDLPIAHYLFLWAEKVGLHLFLVTVFSYIQTLLSLQYLQLMETNFDVIEMVVTSV